MGVESAKGPKETIHLAIQEKMNCLSMAVSRLEILDIKSLSMRDVWIGIPDNLSTVEDRINKATQNLRELIF